MSKKTTDATNFDVKKPKPVDKSALRIGLKPSPGFKAWLSDMHASLAFNTYNIGKLFMLGVDEIGQLAFTDASFRRSMGLSYHNGTLWMATETQIIRFENFLDQGQTSHGHDGIFVPVGATTTGMVNLHDVRASDKGVYFVATNFNCIGKLHPRWSFEPVWKPKFISELAYGDRCHLNSIALEHGVPKYATCFSPTDGFHGWRELARDEPSGVVIDVQTNEVICDGLHMPHSPQIYRDTLYVTNSGKGEFGKIDLETGAYTAICEVPGFTRGITFIKNYAVIGSSKPRQQGVFEGDDATPLNMRLNAEKIDPQCQLSVVSLATGKLEHTLTIEGPASEIYDVAAIPGIQRPLVMDFESEQILTTFRPTRLVL